MKWLSEADLARGAVTELQRQGFETYEEVSMGYAGQRADIVGVRGPTVAVVECKTTLSLKLMDQLMYWRGRASYIIAAVPWSRVGAATHRLFTVDGFGLWLVLEEGREPEEKISPRLHRHTDQSRIRGKLRPQHRSAEYARAGTNGRYYTPFRDTCDQLRRVVKAQPGIELRAALTEIRHHYASTKSAVSAIPMAVRQGLIDGVEITQGKPLRLFPEGYTEHQAHAQTQEPTP